MAPFLYDLRRKMPVRLGLAIALLTMSLLSSLTAKFSVAVLSTDAGKSLVQKTAMSWVNAFLRGDDIDAGATAQLSHPFRNSVWVQRAIKRVAEPIQAVPLDFYSLGQGGKELEITDPDLIAFWETPGIDRSGPMDRADFIEATVGWLKLSGEFFWLLDDTWLTQRFVAAGAARAPIMIARPDRMEPVIADDKLFGWTFTDARGHRHPLVKEQVVHRKFWNPYDDIRGLAEYAAAKIASEADYLAGKFSLNLNRANGDRGVYVAAKGGAPTAEQQEQITRVLREKMMAARRGDFRPVFLSGDVAIEDPKVTSPDADFVAARLQNRHEIFIAFGVPPSMADLVTNYSIGQASDRYLLISETCIPLANGKISGAIEAVSRLFNIRQSGTGLRAKFNFDDHPVMQQVRAERLKSLDVLWQKGMPVRDASDYLSLGLPKFPGDDVGYLPFNVAPIGAQDEEKHGEGENPKSEAGDQTSEEKSLEELFAERRADDPVVALQAAFSNRKSQIGNPQSRGRDPRRVALANAHLAARRPTIKAYASKFTAQLMQARRECLAKLASHQKSAVRSQKSESDLRSQTSDLKSRAVASDFLFDLEKFKRGLQASMRAVALNAMQIAGDALFEEVGFEQDDPFTMPPDVALRYLDVRENYIAGASDQVYERIKTQLEEGIRAGESIAKLTARLKGEFNNLSRTDATRIAMTETSAVYGVARQVAMNQAGVQYKQWLTSGLPNVRPAHAEAEGQTVGVDETFEVGGDALMHPGDPNGAPENIINCHCVSIAVANRPSDSDKENAS